MFSSFRDIQVNTVAMATVLGKRKIANFVSFHRRILTDSLIL